MKRCVVLPPGSHFVDKPNPAMSARKGRGVEEKRKEKDEEEGEGGERM